MDDENVRKPPHTHLLGRLHWFLAPAPPKTHSFSFSFTILLLHYSSLLSIPLCHPSFIISYYFPLCHPSFIISYCTNHLSLPIYFPYVILPSLSLSLHQPSPISSVSNPTIPMPPSCVLHYLGHLQESPSDRFSGWVKSSMHASRVVGWFLCME